MRNQWKNSIHIQNFAMAKIKGSSDYPNLHGKVYFQQKSKGVLVTAEIFGLPSDEGVCSSEIFGFHIHEGNECTGTIEDPFANAKSHYDIAKCKHPEHAGDMPPLFGNHGYAYLSFLTDRFLVRDILNRVVVIHSLADDFTTQPSGNSGKKIACGKIIEI